MSLRTLSSIYVNIVYGILILRFDTYTNQGQRSISLTVDLLTSHNLTEIEVLKKVLYLCPTMLES